MQMKRRSPSRENKTTICDGTTTLHHSQFNHKLWVMMQSIKYENQPKNIFPIFLLFLPLHVCLLNKKSSAFFGWLLDFELYSGAMPSLGR